MVRLPVAHTERTIELAPRIIIGLGLNYRDHIAESSSVKVKGFTSEIPGEPILFPKTPNVLTGPEEPIVLPRIVESYSFDTPRTDYEAELAFIVGRECSWISEDDALDYIFGFTCMNDVSQRNIQNGDRSGWFRGKSFDTFGPIGPVVVRTRDIGNPGDLMIQSRLNGETVQSANTGSMIFSVPEILAFISRNITLQEGDIVTTGTPSGVGPLAPGDVIEIEIEKIGTLRNPVRS
jgi:2-keto-4-pentenoate hydratase/2-oxohepta-3-ene-1,7-dioic acid hydratase in catechol pathway